MVEAYILLKISREVYVKGVVNELRNIENVEDAEMLFGDYDAIVKIKGEKIHDIENLVVEKISRINGVSSTMTMICVDEKIIKE
jgi:DNA-binding Lrp family transcriptional regulator